MSGGDWKEMFNAAVDGDVELVAFHVEAGVDLNYAHPEFLSTPLVAAILARQGAVAMYLLAQGANPSLPSEFDGMNPLGAARHAGLADVEQRLRDMGACVALPEAPSARTSGAGPGGPGAWLKRLWTSG